jgi:hypothetical protein
MIKKAWIVTDNSEEFDVVVFEETRGQAKQTGIIDLENSCGVTDNFIGIKARRAKKYDIYTDKGEVPTDVLISDGWHLTCHGENCGMTISSSLIENCGAGVINGHPYCGKCIDKSGGVTHAR